MKQKIRVLSVVWVFMLIVGTLAGCDSPSADITLPGAAESMTPTDLPGGTASVMPETTPSLLPVLDVTVVNSATGNRFCRLDDL